VTAMSMIVAITGLRALAFFLNFLKFIYFFSLHFGLLNVFLFVLINIMT
jgi:hypothetical protein